MHFIYLETKPQWNALSYKVGQLSWSQRLYMGTIIELNWCQGDGRIIRTKILDKRERKDDSAFSSKTNSDSKSKKRWRFLIIAIKLRAWAWQLQNNS